MLTPFTERNTPRISCHAECVAKVSNEHRDWSGSPCLCLHSPFHFGKLWCQVDNRFHQHLGSVNIFCLFPIVILSYCGLVIVDFWGTGRPLLNYKIHQKKLKIGHRFLNLKNTRKYFNGYAIPELNPLYPWGTWKEHVLILDLGGKLLQHVQKARSKLMTGLLWLLSRISKTAVLQEWHWLSAFVSVCHSNHRSEQDIGTDNVLGTGNA